MSDARIALLDRPRAAHIAPATVGFNERLTLPPHADQSP